MTNVAFWTDEKVGELTRLWDIGKTGSEIAKELSCSRSAVLGKANRLGLPPRVDKSASKPLKIRRAGSDTWTAWQPKPRRERNPDLYNEIAHSDLRRYRTLDQLRLRDCRYVIGAPDGMQTVYCAENAKPDSSYCEAHHKLCYYPAKDQKPQVRTNHRQGRLTAVVDAALTLRGK